MSISINAHYRLNWTLEDLNGKVVLEPTKNIRGDIGGINIGVADPTNGKATLWLCVEEAQSLRDWLVASLPA
jgi:hypothetical protein